MRKSGVNKNSFLGKIVDFFRFFAHSAKPEAGNQQKPAPFGGPRLNIGEEGL